MLPNGYLIFKPVPWLNAWLEKKSLAGKPWKAEDPENGPIWIQPLPGSVANGVDEALLWERVPLTVAKAEKAIGKKEFASLADGYVVKKPGKPALVEESDKRPAITNKITAAEAFKEECGCAKESGADLS